MKSLARMTKFLENGVVGNLPIYPPLGSNLPKIRLALRIRNCRWIETPARRSDGCSLQHGVFCFGFFQDRDVRVGVFPEREEILVGSPCLGLISRQNERSA